jgi:excisionase family DNA binding protein
VTTPQIVSELDDKFITTRQAAQQLGVSLRTVQLWCNSGHVCVKKTLGGHRRILQSEINHLSKKMGNESSTQRLQGKRVMVVTRFEFQAKELKNEFNNQRIEEILSENGGAKGMPEISYTQNLFQAVAELGVSRPDALVIVRDHPSMNVFDLVLALTSSGTLKIPVMVYYTTTGDCRELHSDDWYNCLNSMDPKVTMWKTWDREGKDQTVLDWIRTAVS